MTVMDDLISRSKAIRWIKAECNPYGQPTLDYESGIKVINYLEHMSSARPVRRGRWKQTKAYPNIIFCDECGEPFEKSNSNDKWNYCPNCGTRMVEEE